MKLRITDIGIPVDNIWLAGELAHEPDVRGLALILRPSGSPITHTRELRVAGVLQQAGFATLLMNMLTGYEETRDPDARFHVPQMTGRVLAIAEWASHQPPLAPLAIGLVASDTASGAAVRAACKAPGRFAAIVCRGGRPDLAGLAPLNALTTPLRMVVGADDPHAGMIRQAWEHVRGVHDWHTVEGAGETFDGPGTLERFAQLAGEWLTAMLPAPAMTDDPEHVESSSPDHSAHRADNAEQPPLPHRL